MHLFHESLFLGLVPEPPCEMAAAGEDGHQHNEATRLTHALLQPAAHAHQCGAHDQLPAPGPMAGLPTCQHHTNAQHPWLHGPLTESPAWVSPTPWLPQHLPVYGAGHAGHAAYAASTLPVPAHVQ